MLLENAILNLFCNPLASSIFLEGINVPRNDLKRFFVSNGEKMIVNGISIFNKNLEFWFDFDHFASILSKVFFVSNEEKTILNEFWISIRISDFDLTLIISSFWKHFFKNGALKAPNQNLKSGAENRKP